MADFEVIVLSRAQQEITDALEFYIANSETAAERFIAAVEKAYAVLAYTPFFEIRYKNVRSLKLQNFPYSLFYVVEEEKFLVKVLACFHNKRNPSDQP